MRHVQSRSAGLIALLTTLGVLSACSQPMELKSDMKGRLEGDMALKLEGPIQMNMQLQGPTIRYEGTSISDELLERVNPGKTTGEWVEAVFGEPSKKTPLSDGTEIWRWTYKPVAQEVSVVSLFGGGSEKEPKLASTTVYVQLRDGIVIDKWKG